MCIPVQSSSRFLMVTHLSVFKLMNVDISWKKGAYQRK